jgi:hypothetical protein
MASRIHLCLTSLGVFLERNPARFSPTIKVSSVGIKSEIPGSSILKIVADFPFVKLKLAYTRRKLLSPPYCVVGSLA